MIKRIPSDQIEVGMYIHDINCGWMAHPFLLSRFKITKQSEIEKIIEYGIRAVYIDTSLGLDAPGAQTQAEVHAELDRGMRGITRTTEKPIPHISVGQEMAAAKRVLSEARGVVRDILTDARLGRQVELERIAPVAEGIIDSVLRNPGALTSLGRVKHKDNYTFEHSVNVAVLLVNFCQHLDMDVEVVRDAAIGGLLHDIGKMKTPDNILNKPGKLSDEEFTVMRQHVVDGIEILRRTPGISPISMSIVSQHHEHIDGNGYPAHLKGVDISQLGQMAAIVDVYDALTSLRVYHQPMEPTEALRKLFEWSKVHFNLELVEQYIQCIGIYPVGTLVRLESGLIGVVIEECPHNLLRPTVRVVHDSKNDCSIVPRDIDLSAADDSHRIVAYESTVKSKIDPRLYM